jgi:perosamine synthetase
VIEMSSPDLTDRETEAILAVLRTPRLSMGPRLESFEGEVARRVGARHAIAVSSGTAGLHLAVRAVGIQDGDLAITSPFSFVASANVLLYERALPIFVDVDPETGNLDAAAVESAAHDLRQGGEAGARWRPRRAGAGGDLKGLLSVDVFGQPADHDELNAVARRFGLFHLEDSCEAFGSSYRGRPAGRLGEIGVFAFYPNKQMTTGEGGIIVCDDDSAAGMMRALRNQGRAPGDTWLQHTYLGYNYRMDEMSAALGLAQLQRLDELLERRAQVAAWYDERIAEIAGVSGWPVRPTTTTMSWFVYVVRLDGDRARDRDRVARDLEAAGVPSRPYFSPIHLQPYFVERFGYRPGDFPTAEDLGRRSLALPFSGVLTEDEVDTVCQALSAALHR